jgi:hypothetical protein
MPALSDNPSPAPAVRVVEAATRGDRERFLVLPERLYRGDPHWVPPLLVERRAFLDPRKNPFFEHAEVKLFLAVDDAGVVRGRIAGIVNRRHLEVHRDGVGFFGLFECERDQGVAGRLFDAVAGFLRSHGLEVMRGPENLSVNDDIGLLTRGYDSPPTFMMPYNPPYYRDLVEGYGFSPAMALWAYQVEERDGPIPERLTRGVERARRRHGYTVRSIDMHRLEEDLGRIHEVYTEAWRDNWGAVPMTRRELDHVASGLRWFGDVGLCLIAEVGGEAAGFSLALPDLNQALIKVGGRLLPFGVLKLLWHRRRIDTLRMLMMGVVKRFRYMAIDACLYHETIVRGLAKGYRRLEMSWILENNLPMNRVLQKLGARIAKTYQLYDHRL